MAIRNEKELDAAARPRKTFLHGLLLFTGVAAFVGPALAGGMEYLRGQDIPRRVKLSYRGHFVDFWGLRVGPRDYECPPSEWQFAIAPGICVWSQEEIVFSLTN